jgi:ribosomal protein L12E/L44/L45/RPP1/RPP2
MKLDEVYNISNSDPTKLRWVNRLVSKLSGSLDDAFKSGKLEMPATAQKPGEPAAATGSTPTPPAAATTPKTPEQIRIEKQKAAAAGAQAQMAPFSKVKPATPKTPAEIRQEKLAAAAQKAQQQMKENKSAASEKYTKLNNLIEAIIGVDNDIVENLEVSQIIKEQEDGKISDYIFNYITKYVGGKLKDSKQENNIRNLAKQIEQIYLTTKDPKEINRLLRTISNVAYDSLVKKAQSSLTGTTSAGAGAAAPAPASSNAAIDIRKLISSVKNLDANSLAELKKVVDKELQVKKSSQPV